MGGKNVYIFGSNSKTFRSNQEDEKFIESNLPRSGLKAVDSLLIMMDTLKLPEFYIRSTNQDTL